MDVCIHAKFQKCQSRRFIRKSEGLGKTGIYMYIGGSQKIGDLYINRVVLENQGLREKILQKEYFP